MTTVPAVHFLVADTFIVAVPLHEVAAHVVPVTPAFLSSILIVMVVGMELLDALQ